MEEKTLENVKLTDFYVEDKKVKDAVVVGETPLKDPVFKVSFEEGDSMTIAEKKFNCIRTTEKSDATEARAALVKKLGSEIYAMMMEYGVKFAEIDPLLNEVVRLVNDGQNTALDILWGNDGYDRSLLDVNRVLLTKYAEPETKPEPETEAEVSEGEESADGTPSTGSDADTKVEG